MKNHHVSEGKTCKANKDGTDVTYLAALCKSLPDHLLEEGATDCTWCPGGVDHSRRVCKGDIKLFQQEFSGST